MDGYHDDEYLLDAGDSMNSSDTPSLRGGSDESGYSQQYVETASGTKNWLVFVVAVGLWFLAALIIKTCCFLICKQKNKILPSTFEHALTEARKEKSSQNSPTSCTSEDTMQTLIYQSYGGDFYIKYDDCGKIRSGFVKIQLKNNGRNGYNISGMIVDADGCATITDGHTTYAGDTWWVQEVQGKDEEKCGLKVVTQGKFTFSSNTFSGDFVANSGTRGRYLKFEGKDVNATTAASQQTTVPVAIAVPNLNPEQAKEKESPV